MRYKRNNFFDTSQILNNYVAYRTDSKSPLILQPKFVQETISIENSIEIVEQTEYPNYFQRELKWFDSFAENIGKTIKEAFGDFLIKWEEPLSQLIDFTAEKINPSLEKPTGHSLFTTLIYLFGIYQLQSDLLPDLAISGDGGVYIEFQFNDKFVSIQVDSASSEKDRIYVEQGNQFGSTKLTEESLKEIFTR